MLYPYVINERPLILFKISLERKKTSDFTLVSLANASVAATRRITGSLIGTMGIVTLLPFVQLDGLWKCIYDTFPGPGLKTVEPRRNSAAYMHIEPFSFNFKGL